MTGHHVLTAVHLTLRIGLGLMFIVAGVLKISDVDAFATQISNYQFFAEYSGYFGITVPAIEIVIGSAIILSPKLWRQSAAWVLLAMLVGFTVAVVRAWWLGIDVECGCFGAGSTPIGPWVVLRNVGLMSATALLLAIELHGLGVLKRPFAELRVGKA